MQMMSFFREEAVAYRFSRLPGQLTIEIPHILNFLTFLFFTFATIATTVILLAEFSKKEVATGHLVPSLGLVRITTSNSGFLQELHVAQGDHVKLGQSLAVVSSENSELGGKTAIEQQILAENQSSDEIDHQLTEERANFEIRSQRLMAKELGLKLQIQALNDDTILRKYNIENLRRETTSGKILVAKQVIPIVEIAKRENVLLEAELQLSTLNRELINLQSDLSQNHADMDAAPKELGLILSRLNFQKIAIKQKLLSLKSQLRFEVIAPTSGIIDSIARQTGQSVGPSLPLLTLIPDNSVMQAEIFVPARSIAALKSGQTLRLAYDAFPAIRFGYAFAKVTRVNQTVLDPSEASQYGVNIDTPAYRIVADLEQQSFIVNEAKVSLRAGMGFSADIIVERHSLWKWIARFMTESWNAR